MKGIFRLAVRFVDILTSGRSPHATPPLSLTDKFLGNNVAHRWCMFLAPDGLMGEEIANQEGRQLARPCPRKLGVAGFPSLTSSKLAVRYVSAGVRRVHEETAHKERPGRPKSFRA
jgi:hypothetical protein